MRLKDGAIQLTSVTGGTALLTVRGKDHDLDAVELRALADACLAAASTIKVRRKCPYRGHHTMPTRLFHLLARTAGDRVRIVDGDGPRAFPDMVIYNPPEGWAWPERYLFRPVAGDVLEISDTYEANGERWYKVPYIDEARQCINMCPGIRAASTVTVTVATANAEALEIMRLRMRDWLDERNEREQASERRVMEYSRTSMAADVAPWLDMLDQAQALCERAGWPS